MAANGRGQMRPNTSGRTPPFVIVGLLVVIGILAFNYWNVSSKNATLLNEADEIGIKYRSVQSKKVEVERRHDELNNRIKDMNLLVKNRESTLDELRTKEQELNHKIEELAQEMETTRNDLNACDDQVGFVRQNITNMIRAHKNEIDQLMDERRQAIDQAKSEASKRASDIQSSCSQAVSDGRLSVLRTVQKELGTKAIKMLQQAGLSVEGIDLTIQTKYDKEQPQQPQQQPQQQPLSPQQQTQSLQQQPQSPQQQPQSPQQQPQSPQQQPQSPQQQPQSSQQQQAPVVASQPQAQNASTTAENTTSNATLGTQEVAGEESAENKTDEIKTETQAFQRQSDLGTASPGQYPGTGSYVQAPAQRQPVSQSGTGQQPLVGSQTNQTGFVQSRPGETSATAGRALVQGTAGAYGQGRSGEIQASQGANVLPPPGETRASQGADTVRYGETQASRSSYNGPADGRPPVQEIRGDPRSHVGADHKIQDPVPAQRPAGVGLVQDLNRPRIGTPMTQNPQEEVVVHRSGQQEDQHQYINTQASQRPIPREGDSRVEHRIAPAGSKQVEGKVGVQIGQGDEQDDQDEDTLTYKDTEDDPQQQDEFIDRARQDQTDQHY